MRITRSRRDFLACHPLGRGRVPGMRRASVAVSQAPPKRELSEEDRTPVSSGIWEWETPQGSTVAPSQSLMATPPPWIPNAVRVPSTSESPPREETAWRTASPSTWAVRPHRPRLRATPWMAGLSKRILAFDFLCPSHVRLG